MRIFLDEDYRYKEGNSLSQKLRESGHDVVWSCDPEKHGHLEAELRGKSDAEVGKWATQEGRLIITKDKSTFVHENFEAGQYLPRGVVISRLSELPQEVSVAKTSQFVDEHGENLHGNITVLEPDRYRTRTVEEQRGQFERTQEETQKSSSYEASEARSAGQGSESMSHGTENMHER